MKIIGLAVAAGLATAATGAAAAPQAAQTGGPVTAPATARPAEAALNALIADYETYLKAIDPFAAGGEGDVEAMGRVPDLSRAFELAQRAPL